jgi:hypothetical protein
MHVVKEERGSIAGVHVRGEQWSRSTSIGVWFGPSEGLPTLNMTTFEVRLEHCKIVAQKMSAPVQRTACWCVDDGGPLEFCEYARSA